MRQRIVSLVAGLALLMGTAGVIEAAGGKPMGGRGSWSGQTWKGSHGGHHGHKGGHHSHFRVTDTPQSKVFIPHHHHGHHGHGHHGHLPVRPVYPTYGHYPAYGYASTYVAPSYGQWVPGYWSYVWVPQGSTTNVWVPGYYDRDGVWVTGYHATQIVQGGYYQPHWVSGYWSP